MNDPQLRTAFKRKLARRYAADAKTVIVDEFCLRHGAARLDVLALNGRMHGYELKSDSDTLARLPGQIEIYNAVLDRVTLIVGYRHAFEALRMVPLWWGVKLAAVDAHGKIRFDEARDARMNPVQESLSVVRLLWRGEALALLESLDSVRGLRTKPRAELHDRLVASVPLPELRRHVRELLRCRFTPRPAEPQA